MTETSLHLISFTICPFVQRARILLNSKDSPGEITLIVLDNKPGWFLDRVPTGRSLPCLSVKQRCSKSDGRRIAGEPYGLGPTLAWGLRR
ncbi:MAG: glutathione S-transferase N-terminal domain-containing protein [Pseudomonadota bacterium]